MPTLAVPRDELFLRLGKHYTDAEFDELCFEFGVELDEVLTESEAAGARQLVVGGGGGGGGGGEGSEAGAVSGDTVLYYIALPANRSDLLCIEGFARALNIFLGREDVPLYVADNSLAPGGSPMEMVVCPSVRAVRPFIVCAVLRGVTFTPARYRSFIDLQDKLHSNIARKRSLVAIGTHDLDAVAPPFRYAAVPPADISFVPLSQSRAFRGDELLDFYASDASAKHLKPYTALLAGAAAYPLVTDARGAVLSLPPIINGALSRITLATRNVLIECTATDLTKAHTVLNMVVGAFAEYAAAPLHYEQVAVRYEGGAACGPSGATPTLQSRRAVARMATVRSLTGLPALGAAEAAALARRMQLPAAPGSAVVPESGTGAAEEVLLVDVPPARADVLAECDIVEDVAIAYGYNRLARAVPPAPCPGAQQPLNKLTDALRGELAAAGYGETLTFALVSREENYALLREPLPAEAAEGGGASADGGPVVIANPKTEDFQIGRTRMLPGLLKSLAANRARASFAEGVRLFEISDVLLADAAADVGARNERRLAAIYSGTAAGFEVVHGLVDRVMQLLEVPVRPYKWAEAAGAGAAAGAAAAAASFGRGGLRYTIEAEEGVAMFFPGRGARVLLEHADGRRSAIGTLGVLHPEVLRNFGLDHPVSAVEITIEPFLAQ